MKVPTPFDKNRFIKRSICYMIDGVAYAAHYESTIIMYEEFNALKIEYNHGKLDRTPFFTTHDEAERWKNSHNKNLPEMKARAAKVKEIPYEGPK